jgi:hypothetical protein
MFRGKVLRPKPIRIYNVANKETSVLRVFLLRTLLEKRIKLANRRRITVL